jgi:hypothetical protein
MRLIKKIYTYLYIVNRVLRRSNAAARVTSLLLRDFRGIAGANCRKFAFYQHKQ